MSNYISIAGHILPKLTFATIECKLISNFLVTYLLLTTNTALYTGPTWDKINHEKLCSFATKNEKFLFTESFALKKKPIL